MTAVARETLEKAAQGGFSPHRNGRDRNRRRTGRRFVDAEELDACLLEELLRVRATLIQEADQVLSPYFVFSSSDSHNLLKSTAERTNPIGPRNNRAANRERHLLMYLQRVATKNDTFSEFGPTLWGSIAPGAALQFQPDTALTRIAFLERWTAHAAAAALNADAEVAPELCPRLHPNIRLLLDGKFILAETGQTGAFTEKEAEAVANCDGKTPAHTFDLDTLRALREKKIVRWEVEVPALDPAAFQTLVEEISRWRESPARRRWLDRLQPIAALPAQFAQANESETRIDLMARAHHALRELGAAEKTPQRFLYAAGNPIGEDCCRAGEFILGEQVADELTREAEPWIDLWRDSYAFVASRVAASLRALFESAPSNAGAIALPAFLKHCAEKNMPLTSHGLVAPAVLAFQEVKAAFREQLAQKTDAPEWQLTVEECHVVRRNFDYPKFDEYTYPSADLQISATSADDVNRGNFEWLVAELHPPIALLHHCIYWGCPDKELFASELAKSAGGKPNFYHGFFAADFTAHTTVRQMEALRDLTYYVATAPPNSAWQVVPPSQTEVFIDGDNGDVGLRVQGSHKYLGSFARYWIIPLGFHPFSFGSAPHMPRLRCGKVIVQRRSWTVARAELGEGDFTGVSPDLVLAVERLRAARDLPRYIYIRPTEQALRRSGAEGRDKDTKPVFIDLESYLFLEILLRWLTKADEIEVTEMLPDPAHLLWQEQSGRRTFELRTLIVPRS